MKKSFKLFRVMERRVVSSLVPNPIFIWVFIFIRIQGERRWIQQRDIKATWRCRVRVTRVCRGEERINHEYRNYKMIDVLFPSLPQIDLSKFFVKTLLRISVSKLLILNYSRKRNETKIWFDSNIKVGKD